MRDIKDQDKSVTGNIQFRLGWAMIRSRKDIDSGISHLKEANAMLKDNFDIKFKLAQIYLQEKLDSANALKFIEQAVIIEPGNVDALLLKGKILIKEKKG